MEVTAFINQNQVLSFYVILVISFVFNKLPFAGVFFRTVNTLLHESGHAVGAIVTSGTVVKIDINKDTSGLIKTVNSGKWSAFLTSFAGYPFAALISSLLLVLTINGNYKYSVLILLSVAILNLMLFVRNLFGVIWIVAFMGLLTLSTIYASDLLQSYLVLMICTIAFTETFSSTLYITYLGIAKPRKAGDLYNLQKSTGVPAPLWAVINFLVVISILYYTVINYFPAINELKFPAT